MCFGDEAHGHLVPHSSLIIPAVVIVFPKVIFKFDRVAEGDWQIEAHYPGAEIRHIKGSKSKADIDEWLQGSLRIDWLRSQGYAK
jgi:hypothetical protein